ncbi:MAG TPA: hypothetical protein VGU73_00800 [Acidimicrobiia bacterium]|nr:hypothetical protein [Acidimicrobiia bacterium]
MTTTAARVSALVSDGPAWSTPTSFSTGVRTRVRTAPSLVNVGSATIASTSGITW